MGDDRSAATAYKGREALAVCVNLSHRKMELLPKYTSFVEGLALIMLMFHQFMRIFLGSYQ